LVKTIFEAAEAIAENNDIPPEEIAFTLRVIGYQSHAPGLPQILGRAKDLADRFQELHEPCPGLREIIGCFCLAGRLADCASLETEPYSKQPRSINASLDAVFAVEDRYQGERKFYEIEKDLFAISWVIKSIEFIQPLQTGRSRGIGSLLANLLPHLYDEAELAVMESLRTHSFWERLQQLCTLFGNDQESGAPFKALRETLNELSSLNICGLRLPTVESRRSIQLQLTERDLTSAHWHFPRPADLASLRSLVKDHKLAESSPTRIESLVILIALVTGRDINQALSIMVSANFSSTIVNKQCLALRRHVAYVGKPIYAEWQISPGAFVRDHLRAPPPHVWPLPERVCHPLRSLIPENQEGRLIDFLPPTSIPWETRCNNLLVKIFDCTPRQANLKVRDLLIRQSYEISGNRGFVQWIWSHRSLNNKETQRSEQVSLSAYLNAKSRASVETYKDALRKLIGGFGKTPYCEHSNINFGVSWSSHENTAILLRRQIDSATESQDLFAQHNAFTMYSLCLLIVATGHRKSNTPFFFAFDLHLEDRLAFIADKCIVGSEARFVPLADSALKQVDAYRQHLQALAARLKGTNDAVVRHIASLFKSEDSHHKAWSISTPMPQEFGLFFQICPDGSIETIRTGQLDDQFKSAGLDSRIGLFRKTIASYLWDATRNGHLVSAFLGHANDHHPFGPASVWIVADWSDEISPLIETYLTERKWKVQESPLGKLKLVNRFSMLSTAGLQTSRHAYEGRIKERQNVQTRAMWAIKTILTDELLEDNDNHITDELLNTIREQVDELLIEDVSARKAVPTQLQIALTRLKQRGNEVDSPIPYIPYRAESPIKISFSRYLSNANEFRKCWIQLVGTPIGGNLDATERLAQLAICLVVFDAVLDPKRIKASLDSTIGGTGISDYVDTISIRASVETRDHQFDSLTIPGGVSTAFVLGLEAELQKFSSPQVPSTESVLERIEDILKKIYGRTAKVSLKLLCDIFKPWWLIRLPGAIYSIAIGEHNGPCPSHPSEVSLFASQEPEATPLGSGLKTFASRKSAIKAACRVANEEINQLLSSARGCFEKGTAHNRRQRRQLAKQLDAVKTSTAASWSQAQPIVAYLISFARSLIQEGGKKKSSLAFSTIKNYLSWISQELIEAAWDHDISELDYQELNAIYAAVEDACRNKRTAWKLVLELFHQHVRETVGAVDIPRLRSRGNQWKKRCRTSLFTAQAIDHAVKTLSNTNSDSGELASASLTMLAIGLGYGTRRSESAGLKATDFDTCDENNLAIRANVIRDLKSFAGRRVISAPLIESKKLRESIAQAVARSKSISNREPYLLVSSQKDQEIQNIQPIVKAVVDSLKSASANEYAVYHDLRRTFGTKLSLIAMPLKSGHSGLERARKRLLGNCPPTQDEAYFVIKSMPKNPYLFDAIGRVLGHTDESTLLNVYFLGSPIILADCAIVASRGIIIDDGRLGNILGKDRTTIVKMKQRLKQELPEASNDALIRHYIPKYFAHASQPTPSNIVPLVLSREAKPPLGSPWAWFDEVLCYRKEHGLSLLEAKQTALERGIPDEEATSFLDNYEQMLLDTGFSDFEPDNSSLIDGPPDRGDGLLRGAKERKDTLRRISRLAFNDDEFRKLLVWQISSWQRYVAHRKPWLVCRRPEEFQATLSFLCRIGAREEQIRCETVTTLAAPLLQAVSKRLPTVIVHEQRRFSHSPSNTKANEIGINIDQSHSSKIPDGRDFHRMMALIACLPALKTTK